MKFTKKGAITINLKSENSFLTIEVEDTGCGMSEENIKKLFSPFVMLEDKEGSNANGTGLGLFICKTLCEKMGGKSIALLF